MNSCLEIAQRLVGDTKVVWKKVRSSDELEIAYSFCLGSDVQSADKGREAGFTLDGLPAYEYSLSTNCRRHMGV